MGEPDYFRGTRGGLKLFREMKVVERVEVFLRVDQIFRGERSRDFSGKKR